MDENTKPRPFNLEQTKPLEVRGSVGVRVGKELRLQADTGYFRLVGSEVTLGKTSVQIDSLPAITFAAGVLKLGERVQEGFLVESVALAWFEIMRHIERDPEAIYQIEPRKWEELIAGAYEEDGYEVILTPRSGDYGRDVIATKDGVGAVRIYDQVKAYKPGNIVTAEDVRAMGGVLLGFPNVSKAVITTTSTFAPRIEQDEGLKTLIPYRIELKPRDVLLPWLHEIATKAKK